MKKQLVIRIAVIGAIHAFLYLYLVPFVLFPKFGENGFKMAIIVAVVISVAVLGTLLLARSQNGDRNENN